METSRSFIMPSGEKVTTTCDVAQGIRGWLGSRQGLIVAGVVLAIPAIVLGWKWLGAAAMLQLLFVLPCAAMMLTCMRGMGQGKQDASATQDDSTIKRSDDARR